MFRKRYILPITVVLLLIFSCTKDKVPLYPSGEEECSNFISGLMLSYFNEENIQYKTPCFNPMNSDEFVYYFMDKNKGHYQLCKYNLLSKTKTLIVNKSPKTQPKWSRKGWIAFDNNYHIWIVKDNGDSLRQLTQNTCNLYPAWDNTGTKLFWQHSPVLGYPYYFLKQSIYNSLPDTVLNDYAGYNDISTENKLLSYFSIGSNVYIGFSNTNSISFQPVLNLWEQNLHGLTSLCWSADGKYAYFSDYSAGLIKLDMATGVYEVLIHYCDSKKYISISCSPDGKKLIAQRQYSYQFVNTSGEKTGKIMWRNEIYLIDLETLEQTKVDLE